MRPFSPRMFPHKVRVRAVTQESGDSAGPVEVPGQPGPELPCRVRTSNGREGMAAMSEVALVRGQVAFPADPGVKLGDRLDCGPVSLRALGPARGRGADGVLWVVDCEVAE